MISCSLLAVLCSLPLVTAQASPPPTGADCAHSTCYYIDAENGLDANDGLSKVYTSGNHGPWKHAPMMAGAAGVAAAHTVQQTDALVFKGGVVNSLATGSLPWNAAWDSNRYGAAMSPNPPVFQYPGNYIGYDPTWNKGEVLSIFITDSGIGCTSLTIHLLGGGGNGAIAMGNLEPTNGYLNGFPRNVRVTNPGSGYTSNPTVDFSGSQCAQLPTAVADIESPVFDFGGQLWNGQNGAGGGGPGVDPVAFYGWDYGTMDHLEWRNMQIDSINTTRAINMVGIPNCNYCTVQYNYFHNWFGSSHKLGANTSAHTALAYNFFYPLVLGGGGYANVGTALLYNRVENSEAEVLGEPTSDVPTTCGWNNNYPNPTTPSHLDPPCAQGGGIGGAQSVAFNIVHNTRDGLRGGPPGVPLTLHDNQVWAISNDCCSQHADGIYLGNSGQIYNNELHDLAGGSAAFYIETTSGGDSPAGFGMELFNNKCWNMGSSTPCIGWTSEFFGSNAPAPSPPVVLSAHDNTFQGYYGTGVCMNSGQWFGKSGSYVMSFNLHNNVCISDQTGDPYMIDPVPGGNPGNLYNGLVNSPANLATINTQNVMLTTQQALHLGYIQSYLDYLDSPHSSNPVTRRYIRTSTHLQSTSAPGPDIYISQNAAGGDTGINCSNAHSSAWFNTAANWGTGAGLIGPGTTVHLCGTFTFPVSGTGLTVHGSGASGSPITILFEPGAVLQSPAFLQNNFNSGALVTNGNSWLVIDGGTTAQGGPNGIIQNTDNGTRLTYHQWSMGINAADCSRCEIKNLIVRNLYVHTSVDDLNDMDGNSGVSISGSHWRVDHNIFHDIRWALGHSYNAGDTDNQVDHNEFYNIDHGFTLASGTSGTASNDYFHDNYVHDYANWDTTSNMFHHDGIHSWNSAEMSGSPAWGSFSGLYVYNNRFDGDCGGNFNQHIFLEGGYDSTGRTPWTTNFASPNAYIYGNLFRCADNPPRVHWLFSATGPAVVFNNTAIGNDPAAGAGVFHIGGTGLGGVSGLPASSSVGLDVRNNLLSGENTLIGGYATDTWAHLPDHDFYGYYTNSYNAFWGFGVDVSNFAAWQSACHCDANSTADPQALTVLDAGGMPVAGSWLIGHGQNMFDAGYSLPGMGVDINGNARPAAGKGNWDVGAYQYCPPGACTQPPAPSCGDGICDANETCSSCPSDCGVCAAPPPVTGGLPPFTLDSLNNKTFTLTDEIGFTYPVSGVAYAWVFQPVQGNGNVGAGLVPARTGDSIDGQGGHKGRPYSSNGPAPFSTTTAPRFTPSAGGLSPGTYDMKVTASKDGQSVSATARVTLVIGNLSGVQVYPNPWRSDKHAAHPTITFAGLTLGTTIKIFTTSGHLVKELHTEGPSISWDLTNDSGDKVASGIYMYLITDGQGDKVRGKLAVIR